MPKAVCIFLAQHYYLKLVDVLLWLEIIVSGVTSELLQYNEEQMTGEYWPLTSITYF